MSTLFFGIFLAIVGSASNNFGLVLQKKVVNEVSPDARDKRFFRTLAKRPLWLLGIFMQIGISSACLLLAQYHIGPTLVPGLQGVGLIVLAIGSVRINNETLEKPEIVGILLLILATALVGVCELEIEVSKFDFQQTWFFRNAMVFTGIISTIFILLELTQRRSGFYIKSILLSLISGFMYALSDFWTSPLVGTIGGVFKGEANWTEWSLFLMACVLLISSNILAIGKTQMAFKYGPASILIPLRHVPSLVAPVFVYFFVYSMTAPKNYSLWFFLVSIVLITISSYLLGRREEQFMKSEEAAVSERMGRGSHELYL